MKDRNPPDTSGQTQSLHSEAGAGPLQGLRLFVVRGPDQRQQVDVGPGPAVIGTAEGCDLVLTDRAVSRRHVSIETLGGRLTVKDLGSRNGTRYHGAKVTTVEVPWGATIIVGQTHIALLPARAASERLSQRSELGGLHGGSLPMRRLFAEVERLAPTDVPVLVFGETGTGKEGVARGLHQLSARSAGPFRVFDCGSVPPTLVASALFGHARGAFTGAVGDAAGALELADGGTLFLDELGELPLDVQPVFMRALETRSFCRVGDTVERRVDVRIVAATHRDLAKRVKAGTFRENLYHRIAGATVRVPPLRERAEDIPLLIEHFAARAGRKAALPPAALAMLTAYRWPGNVRELENVVERMLTLGPDIFLDTLVSQGGGSGGAAGTSGPSGELGFKEARTRALEVFEKTFLESVLDAHGGSVAAAAQASGVTRAYLYKLMEAHRIPVRKRPRTPSS